MLQHVGAEKSAHETITAEQERWGGIAQLVAEYETIATAAQHDRWATLLRASGLTAAQVDEALGAETFGALAVALRRAEADGHPVDRLMPRLVRTRDFSDADDIASVLHYRLERAVARLAPGNAAVGPRLIVGLIPEASGEMETGMHEALEERRVLIEARAVALLDTAVAEGAGWVQSAGAPPDGERELGRWRSQLLTIAAYRDRYSIDPSDVLGAEPESEAQRIDYERARAALNRARQIANQSQQTEPPRSMPQRGRTGPTRS